MTLWLVKNSDGDFRLHRDDGTEITTWSSDPRQDSNGKWVNPVPGFVDGIAASTSTPADALLGDQQARRDHAQVVSGDWHFRDLTIPNETVPWQ